MIKKSYIILGLALPAISAPISAIIQPKHANQLDQLQVGYHNGTFKSHDERQQHIIELSIKLENKEKELLKLSQQVKTTEKIYNNNVISYIHSEKNKHINAKNKLLIARGEAQRISDKLITLLDQPSREVSEALIICLKEAQNQSR